MPVIPRPRSPAHFLLVVGAILGSVSTHSLGQGLAESTGPAAPAVLPTNPVDATAPAYVPHVPAAVTRPAGWPGGMAAGNAARHVLSTIRANPDEPLEPLGAPQPIATADAPGGVEPAHYAEPAAGTAAGEVHSLEAALVVARVGPEVVLEADLLTPKALEWLEKVSPGLPPDKVRELRLQICQQVIDQHIETLLVYVDACRDIPADKLP